MRVGKGVAPFAKACLNTCCASGCGTRDDSDTAETIRHTRSDPDLGSDGGLKKPREERSFPGAAASQKRKYPNPLAACSWGQGQCPIFQEGKLRHRGAATCPRPSSKRLGWQAFEHISIWLCDRAAYPQPLSVSACAGQGGGVLEKNGHRLEELGFGRGLEGQAEVSACHPQTGGSHREASGAGPSGFKP